MSTSKVFPGAALAAVVLVIGCAHDEPPKPRALHQWSIDAPREPGQGPDDDEGAGADGLSMDNELGLLDTKSVEGALAGETDRLRACYGRAGRAQDYAGGRVVLRFLVDGNGRTKDVWVAESTLGNYAVERCLVHVARAVTVAAPRGHKATTFDFPIEFRSTNRVEVLEIDGLKLDLDVAALRPQIAACGRLGKEAVAASLYIEPNGFAGSVGLASEEALSESASRCVVQAIRRRRMSTVLPGRVLRANFVIPPRTPPAEAASP